MTNKEILKKTVAGLTAFTLVAGTLPANVGGFLTEGAAVKASGAMVDYFDELRDLNNEVKDFLGSSTTVEETQKNELAEKSNSASVIINTEDSHAGTYSDDELREYYNSLKNAYTSAMESAIDVQVCDTVEYDGYAHKVIKSIVAPSSPRMGYKTYTRIKEADGDYDSGWTEANADYELNKAGVYSVYACLANSTPNDSNLGSPEATFRITPALGVGEKPILKTDLVYTGDELELTANRGSGTMEGDRVEFAVTSTNETIRTFTAKNNDNQIKWVDVPKAKDAGSYKVWYRVSRGETHTDFDVIGSVTIAKASLDNANVTTPENLTYNSNAHYLVTSAPNGTMFRYKKSTDGDYSAWSTDKPQGTDAGEYLVQWYIPEGNYSGLGSAESPKGPLSVTIAKANITNEDFTAPVLANGKALKYNGSAQALLTTDEEKGSIDPAECTIEYTTQAPIRVLSGSISIDDINVGDILGDVSLEGVETLKFNGDEISNPIEITSLTYDWAIAYDDPVHCEPFPKNGYNALRVTGKQGTTLTVERFVNEGEDGRGWSSDIPTATERGTYDIYWRIKGGNNYNDFMPENGKLGTVTMEKGSLTPSDSDNANDYTAPTANTELTYTGEKQALVSGGRVENGKGTLEYLVENDDVVEGPESVATPEIGKVYKPNTPNGNANDIVFPNRWKIQVKVGNEPITYECSTLFSGASVYIDGDKMKFRVRGDQGDPGVLLEQYNAIKVTGVTEDTVICEAIKYGWTTEVPKGLNAGDYTVKWRIKGNDNYNGIGEQTINVNIAKADLVESTAQNPDKDYKAPTVSSTPLIYDNTNKKLVTGGSVAEGKGTMEYTTNTKIYSAGNTTYAPKLGDILVPMGSLSSFKLDKTKKVIIDNTEYTPDTDSYVYVKDGKLKYATTYNDVTANILSSNLNVKDALKTVEVTADHYKFETVKAANAVVWSTEVPYQAVKEAGIYNINWRITGNNNYNVAEGSLSTEIAYSKTTLDTMDINEAGGEKAVITTVDGKLEAKTDAYGKYVLIGGTYYVYTNKNIADDCADSAIIKGMAYGTSDKTYNGKTYNYRYTIELPIMAADQKEGGYVLTHANNYNATVLAGERDKLYLGEDGKLGKVVATLKTDETYYYGDKPSVDDVVFEEGCDYLKGKVVTVDSVYFTDTVTNNRIDYENLKIGSTYNMTAAVYVDKNGKNDENNSDAGVLYLKKSVKLEARPLQMCDIYLVDKGQTFAVNPGFVATQPESETNKRFLNGTRIGVAKNYQQDTSNKYYLTIPEDTYTYNGTEQGPVLAFVNPGNHDIVGTEEIAADELNANITNNKSSAKDCFDGGYYFTYSAVTPEAAGDSTEAPAAKYSGDMKINWSIAKATVNTADIKITAKNNLVYDGDVLTTKDDFTVEAANPSAEGADKTLAELLLEDKDTTVSEPIAAEKAAEYTTIQDITTDTVSSYLKVDPTATLSHSFETLGEDCYVKFPGMDEARLASGFYDNSFKIQQSGQINYSLDSAVDHCILQEAGKVWYVEKSVSESKTIFEIKQVDSPAIDYDLKSAGEQKASFTITNPNFNEVEIKDVVATIAKRKVTITPDAKNKATFGVSEAPELKGTIELAKYKAAETEPATEGTEPVTEGTGNEQQGTGDEQQAPAQVLDGNTGFIVEKDGALLGFTSEENIKNLMNQVAEIFTKVGQEVNTTDILKPNEENAPKDSFDYTFFANDAGTYSYAARNTEADVEAGIDAYYQREIVKIDADTTIDEATKTSRKQLLETLRSAAKVSTKQVLANYEFIVPETSVFTLEKAELKPEQFVRKEAGEGYKVDSDDIPYYTFDADYIKQEGSFRAPYYNIVDSYFYDENMETYATDKDNDKALSRITYDDYEVGGQTYQILPGNYKLELAAAKNSNYVGVLSMPWYILSDKAYSQKVAIVGDEYEELKNPDASEAEYEYETKIDGERKEYDGEAVEPDITYFKSDDSGASNEISADDMPENYKTTYTYYRDNGNRTEETMEVEDGDDETYEVLDEAAVATMEELLEAPTDAGHYVVRAHTTCKGYEIDDTFAEFEITPRVITVTPTVNTKVYGDKDPEITYESDLEDRLIEGDTVNFTGSLKIDGNEEDYKPYDGTVGSWTIAAGSEFGLDDDNYTFVLNDDRFVVTPRYLDDANVRTKVCIKPATGWAEPNDCISVVVELYNEETGKYEEVELTTDYKDETTGKIVTGDYDILSEAKTMQSGEINVQIQGKGNFAGFAEGTVNVVSVEDIASVELTQLGVKDASAKKIAFVVNSASKSEELEVAKTGVLIYMLNDTKTAADVTSENMIIENKASLGLLSGGKADTRYSPSVSNGDYGFVLRPYVLMSDGSYVYGDIVKTSYAEVAKNEAVSVELNDLCVKDAAAKKIAFVINSNSTSADFEVTKTGVLIYMLSDTKKASDVTADNMIIENKTALGLMAGGKAGTRYSPSVSNGDYGFVIRPYAQLADGSYVYGDMLETSYAKVARSEAEITVALNNLCVKDAAAKKIAFVVNSSSDSEEFTVEKTGVLVYKLSDRKTEADVNADNMVIENKDSLGLLAGGKAGVRYSPSVSNGDYGFVLRPYALLSDGSYEYGELITTSFDAVANPVSEESSEKPAVE